MRPAVGSLKPETGNQTRMRLRASHPKPHRSWIPALPWSPRERRHGCFSPTALENECRFCQSSVVRSSPFDDESQPLRCPEAYPAPKSKAGRRPQSRTTGRACGAFLEVFPATVPFRESPAPTGSAAIIRQAQDSHVSLHPLSASPFLPATQKLRVIVQNLWTMRLPCGSRRKTKLKSLRRPGPLSHFQ
jgi:hypothetical protein